MTDIEELIESANKLCTSLDTLSQNEKRFNDNLLTAFERMSWEIYKQVNDLKEIQEYLGA